MDLKNATPGINLNAHSGAGHSSGRSISKIRPQFKDFHVLPIYGGQSMLSQLRALERSVHSGGYSWPRHGPFAA